jgi:hypothetical protein
VASIRSRSSASKRPPTSRVGSHLAHWSLRVEAGPEYRRLDDVTVLGGEITAVAVRQVGSGSLYLGASFAGGSREAGLQVYEVIPFVFGGALRMGRFELGGGLRVGEVVLTSVTSDPTAADVLAGILAAASFDVARFHGERDVLYIGARMAIDLLLDYRIIGASAAIFWGPSLVAGVSLFSGYQRTRRSRTTSR